jgi:hypothetical protein
VTAGLIRTRAEPHTAARCSLPWSSNEDYWCPQRYGCASNYEEASASSHAAPPRAVHTIGIKALRVSIIELRCGPQLCTSNTGFRCLRRISHRNLSADHPGCNYRRHKRTQSGGPRRERGGPACGAHRALGMSDGRPRRHAGSGGVRGGVEGNRLGGRRRASCAGVERPGETSDDKLGDEVS